MAKQASQRVSVIRIPRLHNLEVMHAHYLTQSFTPHTHEEYAIGVIERGALGFYYRHENWVASAGMINLCIPGEMHTGHPAADDGWTYRMFYINPDALRQVASEIANVPCDVPYIRAGVIDDLALGGQIRHLHASLFQHDIPLIEAESRFVELLAQLITRYADKLFRPKQAGDESYAVAKVKQYLEANYAEDVALDDLSHLAHLSRFHLLRVFRQTVGVPPHAYLRQVRLRRAKQMLTQGTPISAVAAATGFTDQSHLTRWFRRLWGCTPKTYSNSVLYT